MIVWAVLLTVAVAAATISTALAVAGQHHGRGQAQDFSWFAARTAPASWQKITLPDHTGTLAAPPSLVRLPADPGTAAAGLPAGAEDLIYLNATPRQGEETLPGWAAFRIAHLRDENNATATLDAHAEGLHFLGGTGSCLLDDYVTRVGAHHYREIACLVQGAHSASVVVAATPAADWDRYRPLLEQAVAAYSIP
jgi:hypothetical protein